MAPRVSFPRNLGVILVSLLPLSACADEGEEFRALNGVWMVSGYSDDPRNTPLADVAVHAALDDTYTTRYTLHLRDGVGAAHATINQEFPEKYRCEIEVDIELVAQGDKVLAFEGPGEVVESTAVATETCARELERGVMFPTRDEVVPADEVVEILGFARSDNHLLYRYIEAESPQLVSSVVFFPAAAP